MKDVLATSKRRVGRSRTELLKLAGTGTAIFQLAQLGSLSKSLVQRQVVALTGGRTIVAEVQSADWIENIRQELLRIELIPLANLV